MTVLHHLRDAFGGNFLSPSGYFFWGWLLIYGVVATALGWREERSLRGALRSIFPARAFRGPSAMLDYQTFLLSHCLLLYPLGYCWLGNQDRIARALAALFRNGHAPAPHGFALDALYTGGLLLAADLGWTLQHLAFHRVPWLWRIHRIHHSATELNLFTIARLHPLDALSQIWAAGITVGFWIGAWRHFLGYSPSVVLFLNASAAMALFRLFGIYRHSHVWISFGPWLSRIFCSPAMHQIHHSAEARHHDRNFSTVFSLWDWLLGTLYVPSRKETLRFGLDLSESEQRAYRSYFRSLCAPFARSAG